MDFAHDFTPLAQHTIYHKPVESELAYVPVVNSYYVPSVITDSRKIVRPARPCRLEDGITVDVRSLRYEDEWSYGETNKSGGKSRDIRLMTGVNAWLWSRICKKIRLIRDAATAGSGANRIHPKVNILASLLRTVFYMLIIVYITSRNSTSFYSSQRSLYIKSLERLSDKISETQVIDSQSHRHRCSSSTPGDHPGPDGSTC